MPAAPGSEASNGADDALIAYAKKNAIPLITNEGYTVRGLADEKMRKRAKDAGVYVYAPHEFYAGKINESDEIEAFFERFKEQAPLHLESRRTKFGPGDKMGHTLDWVFNYYRMILLGEVEGRDKPIRVRVV